MANEDVYVVLFEGEPANGVRLASSAILQAARDLRSTYAFLALLRGAPAAAMTFRGKKPGDKPRQVRVQRLADFQPGP